MAPQWSLVSAAAPQKRLLCCSRRWVSASCPWVRRRGSNTPRRSWPPTPREKQEKAWPTHSCGCARRSSSRPLRPKPARQRRVRRGTDPCSSVSAKTRRLRTPARPTPRPKAEAALRPLWPHSKARGRRRGDPIRGKRGAGQSPGVGSARRASTRPQKNQGATIRCTTTTLPTPGAGASVTTNTLLVLGGTLVVMVHVAFREMNGESTLIPTASPGARL